MRWNLAVIGPEAAFPRYIPGRGRRHRPGPQGGDIPPRRRPPRDTRPAHPDHPLPAPAGLSGARSAVRVGFLTRAGGWVVLPGIPCITHPVYPPGMTHPARTPVLTTRYTPGTHRPYTRFDTLVGEPRGSRTHPGLGSQAGLYCI